MAHKKAGGSTSLGRDSQGQRLGVKASDGTSVRSGAIVVRQRGLRYRPGTNVAQGADDTLFALVPGIVHFRKRTRIGFQGKRQERTIVSVVAHA